MRTPTGSVKKRNGQWLARITWTEAETRKRVEKRQIVGSPAEGWNRVEQWLAELRQYGSVLRGRRGTFSIPIAHTFANLAAFYRERYCVPARYENEKKVAGMRSWKTALGHVARLETLLGPQLLRALSYATLQDARDELMKIKTFRGGTCSTGYANRVFSTCRRMLHVARQRGWMQHNPFDQGDPLVIPAHETARERIAAHDEEQRLLAVCTVEKKRAHLRTIIIVAIETGMRVGEILGLTRSDVDMDAKLFRVVAMNSKTLKPRIVPMTERAHRELKRYLRAVPDSWPTIFNVSAIDTAWRGARADAGITDLHFHDLRHTFITRAIAAGVPEALLQTIVGHAPGSKITRRYTNVDAAVATHVAAILDGLKPRHARVGAHRGDEGRIVAFRPSSR